MVRVSLPKEIVLTCPACRGEFSVSSRSLTGRVTMVCPFCEAQFHIYDGLDGLLKRQVYHAIRDSLEQRIYEQKHMESPGYFEDTANLE